MNETVNVFLLESDKFIPEMHLKQPGFTYTDIYLLIHLSKTKKKLKSLCRVEIQMNLARLVFNMIRLRKFRKCMQL